jgi:hypothetical protein
MRTRLDVAAIVVGALVSGLGVAADGLELPIGRGELVGIIRPRADESRWAEIPWETSLDLARKRSIREDKPLLVWRAGGGDVLGRA